MTHILEASRDLAFSLAYPFALRAVVLLNVPKIIKSGGPEARVSAEEICQQLPPGSSARNLEKILELLSCYDIFIREVEGQGSAGVIRYGLTPKSDILAGDYNGGDFLLMLTAPELLEIWPYLHETVTNPEQVVVEKVYGKGLYQHINEDAPELAKFHVQMMQRFQSLQLEGLLEAFDETFKSLEGTMIDVGGSHGSACTIFASRYPNIQHFVNFDLPDVVNRAAPIPRGEHVGGSFLDFVPKGDFMLLKFVVLNWGDEQAEKLLRNCYDSLPSKGWAIVVDFMLPDEGLQDLAARRQAAGQDVLSALSFRDTKHRTESQFVNVAKKAGFSECNVVRAGGGLTLAYLAIHKA